MKRRNIPYQITYILEIILVLLGAIFYRQPLLSVLLLLLVLLPVISIFITKYEFKKLRVNASIKRINAFQNGIINVEISATYEGIIPLLNCMIDMTYENLFYPHKKPQEFVFHADKKKKNEFLLPFSVTKAGMFILKADRLNVTDYLHLYTFTRPINIQIEVPILPDDIEAPSYDKRHVIASKKEGDPTEITTIGGEKTRDTKQIREYRSGDSIKDIHWKLSAKTDELMVKEYEEIKELYYLVFPILSSDFNTVDYENMKVDVDLAKDTLQKTLEVFLSIGKDLIKEKEPFSVLIYNSLDDTFSMKIVTEEKELYEALYELYRVDTTGYDGAYKRFTEKFKESTEGIIIIEDGKVTRKEICE